MTEEAIKEKIKLSKEEKAVIDALEKLNIIGVNNVVKYMEQKYGISAAVPVAAAPASAGGGAGEAAGAEESSEVNIELASTGGQKIAVIKVVREITGLGLKEAKDLVDATPKVIKEKVKRAEAEEMKKKLEAAGATVELK